MWRSDTLMDNPRDGHARQRRLGRRREVYRSKYRLQRAAETSDGMTRGKSDLPGAVNTCEGNVQL